MSPIPWEVIKSSYDKSYRIFNIRTDRAVSPRTKQAHDFYILESAPWVNIIPLTPSREVVLIKQYRHGTRETTLEIPGGLVEKEDDPQSAALRELKEETGYTAQEVHFVGKVHPNPAIQNNICYTYLVKDALRSSEQSLDEKEDIEIILQPLEVIPGLIKNNQITHSLVLCAFFLYYLHWSENPFT